MRGTGCGDKVRRGQRAEGVAQLRDDGIGWFGDSDMNGEGIVGRKGIRYRDKGQGIRYSVNGSRQKLGGLRAMIGLGKDSAPALECLGRVTRPDAMR